MPKKFDVAVIGAGIVGLATARTLLRAGVRRLVVLEAEERIASHQTGHNSGVIHSGLYYRPGSLKARDCIAGREAMYRYCEEAGVPHRRCGKIIVATREDELPGLEKLRRRGTANGLDRLRILGPDELRDLEPEVVGIAGMHIQEAGIVDFGAVAAAFAGDISELGGEIRLGARVVETPLRGGTQSVVTSSGSLDATVLINCAGLQSDRIARLCSVEPGVLIVPFRGEYYDLVPSARPLVRNPIYPVPDPAFPFLGVHLTPTVHGTVEAGPNAVLAFKREGYRRSDVSFRDLAGVLAYSGFRRLVARHWRYGWGETMRSFSKKRFVQALQRLVPRLTSEDLVAGKTGVRAQAVDPTGKLLDDFHILHGERSVHVLNAPSPAATSSISIGERIARHILEDTSLLTVRR
jgi:L-2-hydroxyglutarate oxidase